MESYARCKTGNIDPGFDYRAELIADKSNSAVEQFSNPAVLAIPRHVRSGFEHAPSARTAARNRCTSNFSAWFRK